MSRTLVLGSRSPQRRELLRQICPQDHVEVLPPRSADEAGFDGLSDWPEIEARLREIARAKLADVSAQLQARAATDCLVVTADTVIVAPGLVVLGQPPADDWQDTVRHWFRDHLFGRTHWAATALCVGTPDEPFTDEVLVRTAVTFTPRDDDLLEWYLATGEPRGKAGGYAIQGAGSVFVTKVEGSLSNIVGLPQRELRTLLNR